MQGDSVAAGIEHGQGRCVAVLRTRQRRAAAASPATGRAMWGRTRDAHVALGVEHKQVEAVHVVVLHGKKIEFNGVPWGRHAPLVVPAMPPAWAAMPGCPGARPCSTSAPGQGPGPPAMQRSAALSC